MNVLEGSGEGSLSGDSIVYSGDKTFDSVRPPRGISLCSCVWYCVWDRILCLRQTVRVIRIMNLFPFVNVFRCLSLFAIVLTVEVSPTKLSIRRVTVFKFSGPGVRCKIEPKERGINVLFDFVSSRDERTPRGTLRPSDDKG